MFLKLHTQLDTVFVYSVYMKKVIIILLFNFCWVCGYSAGGSIPELNKQIIKICDSLLGQKIGNGGCGEFNLYVMKMFGYYEKGIYYKISEFKNGDFTYKLLQLDSIHSKRYLEIYKFKNKCPLAFKFLPGDVIFMKWNVKLPGWKVGRRGHTAFIHHRIDDYSVALIHQYKGKNVCIEKFEIYKMYKGTIVIERDILEKDLEFYFL